jgi:hypothetical protein
VVSTEEFERANRRAKSRRAREPHAVTAHFDRHLGRILVNLSNGIGISFAPTQARGLEKARPDDLDPIEILPSGFGLHFPKLDADLYRPALLEGTFGSRKWMAARLGQSGGMARSAAKAASSRANGRLGGRPRKKAAPA